ncbi:UNVERIFIED_CONTAM: hypothetical protein FKN15_038056 [Acipenser sinensis]
MAEVHACTSCTTSPASTTEPYAALGGPGQTAGSAQLITPALELTPSALVIAPDVAEPDVSIAEKDHDAISIVASWEGSSFLLPPLTIPLDQQLRNCCNVFTENTRRLGR